MKDSDRLTLVGLLAILLVAVAPILLSADTLNPHSDGDSFLYHARHEHFRMAVLQYHVFPERTPFVDGGVTPFADPEDVGRLQSLTANGNPAGPTPRGRGGPERRTVPPAASTRGPRASRPG
jgi:hypothetical protein